MMKNTITNDELKELCSTVRTNVNKGEYDQCIDLICNAMCIYPSAPQPHNLLGIILEKSGDHLTAMKHFRAAWALDPSYRPAAQNLSTYGTFFSNGMSAFDESDCPDKKKEKDENGLEAERYMGIRREYR